MSSLMIGESCFDSALLGYLFQDIITCVVARNRENPAFSRITLILFYYSLGDFQ
jgi:hypothetical protein